jgi:hypothetical protein
VTTKIPNPCQPAGAVLQSSSGIVTAVDTTTTLIPYDDTVPTSSEGKEMLSRAITPKATTNYLRVEVVANVATSAAGVITAALLKDADATALSAGSVYAATTGKPYQIRLTYYMQAGTTSEITFKVRVGCDTAGTVTLNGVAGGRMLGGVDSSSITVTEIAA